jgi:hypothetical protein
MLAAHTTTVNRFVCDTNVKDSVAEDELQLLDRLGLNLVGLLLTRADEIFDGLGGIFALPLLEFAHPIGDRVYHVAGGFAGRF